MRTMMSVPYSYLLEQFRDSRAILDDIERELSVGRFTLGPQVEEFEQSFAQACGASHAIGVNSGTDALILSLKAVGVGPGDEVITVPNTFIATVGAIVGAGARPVFVDVTDDYNMDPALVEAAITERTKALLPVHLTGNPVDLDRLLPIAQKHNLPLVEDACHAITAGFDGKICGTFGSTGCFSLHPLKNLNVWGDGGVIVTQSGELDDRLRLMRNHGLRDRDTVEIFGVNSRLDTVQAIVGNHLIKSLEWITQRKIDHATWLDRALSDLGDQVIVPRRDPRKRHVFHIYVLMVRKRDALLAYLQERGVEAKVHYPVPVHLQPAGRRLGYKEGDFPVCERQAGEILSLPVHQHLDERHLQYMSDLIHDFYKETP
jgi:dTDP-4-amino-4,6-dideoxygalactose transaminase